MNIDFKNFHKIETDDNCTTLRHHGGHTIKIARKGLSPETLKELDNVPMKMASGGFIPKGFRTPSKESKPSASQTTMPGSPTEAKHAYTEPQDQGTDVVLAAMDRKAPPFGPLGMDEKQHYPPCINPSCKSYGKSHPNCRCYGGVSEHTGVGEAGHFAEGGEVNKQYFCDDNRAHYKNCEYYARGGGVQKENPEQETPEVPVQDLQTQEIAAEPVEQAAVTPESQSAAPVEAPDYATPEAPSAAPQAPADPVQEKTNQILQERQKIQADFNNGHIKPETYKDLYGKKDTPGKLATIFGMLMGGMGSGLTHQPNALMQMMDNEISRDLDAQKTSAANRQNFLNIAQKGLLNKEVVENQHLLNGKFATDLAAIDGFAKTVMSYPEGSDARKKGMMALALLQQTVDKSHVGMAAQAAMAQGTVESAGGGKNTQFMKSGLMGPGMANIGQDIEQKTISGIPEIAGQQATRPVPESTKQELLNMQILDEKGKEVLDFVKKYKGTLDPQKRAEIKQKIEEMKNFYNNSIRGGALTEGRLGWYDQQFAKTPTDLIPIFMGSTSKLNEMINSNKTRRDLELKSYGFSPKQAGSSKQSPQQQAGPTSSKAGHKIVYKNGKAFYQ